MRPALWAAGILLFHAPWAWAEVAVDSASRGSVSSGTTLSWTHTVDAGPNGLIVVGVSTANDSTTASASYGGQPMTLVGAVGGGGSWVRMFSLPSPPPGSNAVVITFDAGLSDVVGGAVSFSGVD